MTAATILVVEDEALIADDIQRTLVRLGYNVPTTVASGLEAIRAAEQLPPSLVLMDIALKGRMDGIETAAELRERLQVPIVYLTSHSDEATLARAKETRPYGYLVKPFDERDLRTAIEVALHKFEVEIQLERRERWFSTTLHSIGDAVIATDEQQAIRFMNPVAEKLTGWRRDDAYGKRVDEVFRIVDAAGVRLPNPIAEALRDNLIVELPLHAALELESGETLAIDDTAAPIVDAKGCLLGGVLVFRDITERRKLELRLSHSEKLASIGTMAAGMAHEINNPLSSVIGNVKFSLEKLEGGIAVVERIRSSEVETGALESLIAILGQSREALVDANEAGERVQHLAHSIRKFARKEPPKPTASDLRYVLDTAAKMAATTERHRARLVKEYGTTPLVEADEIQLMQVFLNLFVNAGHAIGEGDPQRDRIHVKTFTDDAGRAVVEVSDTGCGIAPENLARIFDPFFTTKPVGSGMGLGLAISYNAIASLGGEIAVESRLHEGTTFRVALPPARSRPLQSSLPPPSTLPPRRARVLVVDDDDGVGRSIERILKPDHEVTRVTSGSDAVAAMTGHDFDIVFCDVNMPTMSGIGVYEAVFASRPEQARRIVFMTAGTPSQEIKDFLSRVTNVTLAKPFASDALRAVTQDRVR